MENYAFNNTSIIRNHTAINTIFHNMKEKHVPLSLLPGHHQDQSLYLVATSELFPALGWRLLPSPGGDANLL